MIVMENTQNSKGYVGIIAPWMHDWGVVVCFATLKPLHLHKPSAGVGNMEVVDRLENLLTLIYCIFIFITSYSVND